MGRELKKYGIRSTRKPAHNTHVSSTVHVVDENGVSGYCYINFEDALVVAVGRKLVWGVSALYPAYLVVTWDAHRKHWNIAARYLFEGSKFCVTLWETAQRPSWLKLITNHGVQNGSDTQKPIRARAGVGSNEAGSVGSRRKARTGRSGADAEASGVAVG